MELGILAARSGRHQEALELLTPIDAQVRKTFAGKRVHIGRFLAALGAATGYDAERFKEAEAKLLKARAILSQSLGERHGETIECDRSAASLYAEWDRAEPGKGYDAKAAEWKAKLDAAPPTPGRT